MKPQYKEEVIELLYQLADDDLLVSYRGSNGSDWCPILRKMSLIHPSRKTRWGTQTFITASSRNLAKERWMTWPTSGPPARGKCDYFGREERAGALAVRRTPL